MGYKTTSTGLQRVVIEKTNIDRVTMFSHNWCDRTTWYTQSVRVVDEVATDSGDQTRYELSNKFIIDTYHGKITEEDYLSDPDGYSYRVVVNVNDVEKTEQDPHYGIGGDYTVDYEDGYIDFIQPLDPADEVEVTYHYENGSMCKFSATAGYDLDLVLTELQFSTDVLLNDTVVFCAYGSADVFAPGQFPPGTMIPLQNPEKFKTLMDFYNDSIRSYPVVPALSAGTWRGMSQPMLVLDWDHVTAQTLHGDCSMELRTWLEHDTPHDGLFATTTFYFTRTESSIEH